MMPVPEVERQDNGLEKGVVGLLKGLLGGQEEHYREEEEVNNLALLLNPTSLISDHKHMAGDKSGVSSSCNKTLRKLLRERPTYETTWGSTSFI